MPHTDRWYADYLGIKLQAPKTPEFNTANLPEHYPPDLELEPSHMDIDLYASVSGRSVGGRVTLTVSARHAGAPTLRLDAVDFENLAVRDPQGSKVNWQYDGQSLHITWEEPFTKQEQRRIEIAYRVVEPAAGLYFATPDDAYPDQPSYVASDHETERARFWLPCIDQPNVRTSLDFHLRADAAHTILANGYLISENDHGDGTKTAHWRLEEPCPSYLICIAIGQLTKVDDGVFADGEIEIPVAYFAGPEHDPEDIHRTFAPTKIMLKWLTDLLLLPFPYPKYYQFALPTNTGAMENISLVAWTDAVIQDHALATEYGWYVDQVNIHEMAHSYFGDAVVCRDFSHAWLKESWATYIEMCWQAEVEGRDAELYVYYRHANHYFKETDTRYHRPIITRRYRSSWDLYDAHLYEGGACRLHTLRNKVGSDVFWNAVRDYLARYQHQVVETDNFRAVLEEHSGLSLTKFFDQWFRTPGFPDLKVTFEYDQERGEGTFTIEQKQVNVDKGIPAFEFDIEVSWTIANNEQRRTAYVSEKRHIVTVPMAGRPEQVRVDPDHKVLHRLEFNPGDPMLRAQVINAPDIIGRIQAAQTLLKSGKHANVETVLDAYHQEPFWGVRCEIAAALGKANHTAAITGLANIIATETEPRVLVTILRSTEHRSSELAGAIQRRLESGLNPQATQAAYQALGRQRAQAPFDLLAEAAAAPHLSWRARSGALLGLAASRQETALTVLQAHTVYGTAPHRVRDAAVTGLGAIGPSQERGARETIREQLVDLLRDPWPHTRWRAARALAQLNDAAAVTALEDFAEPLSTQEKADIERMVAGLRQAAKPDNTVKQDAVDDLREQVRKLEEQLQTITARLDAQNR